jgi:hypothetical protein
MILPTVALTLIQPWGSLIMLTDEQIRKDVENRDWKPSEKRLKPGDRLWIHAGAKLDKAALFEFAEECSHLKGVAIPRRSMLGHVRFDGVVTESKSWWFNGPYGLLVSDPVPLRAPVECLGALGLWTVNESMMAKLREAA